MAHKTRSKRFGSSSEGHLKEPCSFDELVNDHTMRVVDALIRGGFRELKGDLRIAMDSAISWRLLCDKYSKQQKKMGKKHG